MELVIDVHSKDGKVLAVYQNGRRVTHHFVALDDALVSATQKGWQCCGTVPLTCDPTVKVTTFTKTI